MQYNLLKIFFPVLGLFFYGITSNTIFSVICSCRMVFITFYLYGKNISNNGFGFCLTILEVVKNALKNNICQFFGPTLNAIFSVIYWRRSYWILFCYVVRAQRASNEGLKGPPIPFAGARKQGPYCPELLVAYYMAVGGLGKTWIQF